MKHILKTESGVIIKTFDNIRDAEFAKMELLLKNVPTIIESIEDQYCLISNHGRCNEIKCCHFCDKKDCQFRCYENHKNCEYLSDEESAKQVHKLDDPRHDTLTKSENLSTKTDIETETLTQTPVSISQPIQKSPVIQEDNFQKPKEKITSLERQERILNIIEDLQKGLKIKEIAVKYGISSTRVCGIKKQYID